MIVPLLLAFFGRRLSMTAFNVVRFRVKPGCEQEFIDAHRRVRPTFKGSLGGDLVRTGEQTFCIVGRWRSMDALVAARPEMIGILDQLRPLLEDLGGGLGVTDPVAGDVVASYAASKSKKKKKKKNKGEGKAKSAKKSAKKKAGKKKAAGKKSKGRNKKSKTRK
jgi:quinol monooxygenase YgiN